MYTGSPEIAAYFQILQLLENIPSWRQYDQVQCEIWDHTSVLIQVNWEDVMEDLHRRSSQSTRSHLPVQPPDGCMECSCETFIIRLMG